MKCTHGSEDFPREQTTAMEGQVNNGTTEKSDWRKLYGQRGTEFPGIVQLQHNHEEMTSIFQQLGLGTATIDQEGRIAFLSPATQHLFNQPLEDVVGKPWEQVCPFSQYEIAKLKVMCEQPRHLRTKVPAHFVALDGRHYRLEIKVHDDPRDPRRKIFVSSKATEVPHPTQQEEENVAFSELVGQSRPMQEVYQQIRDVAQVDASVLIEGETGTGKELVARAIHNASLRKEKPFIAVNCAGLTESLVASQLFGHRRGAFTGAIADQQGLFEAANGGTLFLDEIGDLPSSVQTHLLRVLQEREILRLGESRPRKIDVRIIAATHRTLCDEVAKGRFRADLLYRLRVARVHLPPLRDRQEDIPVLLSAFLAHYQTESGQLLPEVSAAALQCLAAYAWPGNIRELKNALEYALIRCKGDVIRSADLPPEIEEAVTVPHALGGVEGESSADDETDETARILATLERVRGNRTAAARVLGMSRATLYRRLASLAASSLQVAP